MSCKLQQSLQRCYIVRYVCASTPLSLLTQLRRQGLRSGRTGAMEAVFRQLALHNKRFPRYLKYSCRHYPVQGTTESVKMKHSHIWGFGMHMRAHLHVTELQSIVLIVKIAQFSVPEAHDIRIQMNTCFSGSGLFSCLLLFELENFKLS